MINGIINVYKEKGFTSFDVVARMRGIFHQKKIGHTGTLDPDAEGVLPVCLGRATKVCGLLTDKDKVYEAVMLLGMETDTQDISGAVLKQREICCSEAQVREAVLSFRGEYDQVPPMYSALKVNGQKLCDLARKGVSVERQARRVQIFDITIEAIELPRVKMSVHCSKGTYIRTLCNDIGEKLGCGACMESLLRTRVSAFELQNAWRLSELENYLRDHPGLTQEEWPFFRSTDSVFMELPSLQILEAGEKYLKNGNKIPEEFVKSESPDDGEINLSGNLRVYDCSNQFAGIYIWVTEENRKLLKPVKLFME